jgi:hypothetical protein
MSEEKRAMQQRGLVTGSIKGDDDLFRSQTREQSQKSRKRK